MPVIKGRAAAYSWDNHRSSVRAYTYMSRTSYIVIWDAKGSQGYSAPVRSQISIFCSSCAQCVYVGCIPHLKDRHTWRDVQRPLLALLTFGWLQAVGYMLQLRVLCRLLSCVYARKCLVCRVTLYKCLVSSQNAILRMMHVPGAELHWFNSDNSRVLASAMAQGRMRGRILRMAAGFSAVIREDLTLFWQSVCECWQQMTVSNESYPSRVCPRWSRGYVMAMMALCHIAVAQDSAPREEGQTSQRKRLALSSAVAGGELLRGERQCQWWSRQCSSMWERQWTTGWRRRFAEKPEERRKGRKRVQAYRRVSTLDVGAPYLQTI